MKLRKILLASLLALAATTANAAITLTFEGLQNQESINNFYNGGTGSLGSSGTNYNIAFSSNSLALIDADAGGGGNFGNEPTPSTIMFFLSGSAILNYNAGFDTGFSFYYTTTNFAGTVRVYDDINATGNLLGSIDLLALGAGPGDPNGSFSNWEIGSLAFAGLAKSIDFGGTVNQVGYDNITFGSVDPNLVPEPGSLLLTASALFGLLALRRRKA